MKKESKIANWLLRFVCTFVLFITVFSSCMPQKNICNEGIQKISGEIIYVIPAANCTRTVTFKTETGYIKIYMVPMNQPLDNITACKIHGRWYWVMP